MRFAVAETFRRYLNYPLETPTPWHVLSAWQHTWRYYSQRRDMCKRHYLRPYRLPQLFILQKKVDLAQRECIEKTKVRLLGYSRTESLFRDRTEVRISAPRRFELLKESYPAPGFRPIAAIQSLWTAVYVPDGPIHDRIQGTLQNIFIYLKSLQYIDTLAKWLVTYLNLYHESLQQLIEGHREVTQDHTTKLESGKTVGETISAFEQSLTEHIPKYKDLGSIRDRLHKTRSK